MKLIYDEDNVNNNYDEPPSKTYISTTGSDEIIDKMCSL